MAAVGVKAAGTAVTLDVRGSNGGDCDDVDSQNHWGGKSGMGRIIELSAVANMRGSAMSPPLRRRFSVFGHKDQMHVQEENAVSSMPNVIVVAHRPRV
ncbi:DNA primase [Cupriavidus necator H850]|nr:DNA primase [Cupriavidus necator H850]